MTTLKYIDEEYMTKNPIYQVQLSGPSDSDITKSFRRIFFLQT